MSNTLSLAEQAQTLYQKYGNIEGITIEIHNELLAVNIRNNAAEATVFLQGAQVTHYQRHNEQPIIWLSDAAEYHSGKSLRGGIPICWPWFGDINKNPDCIREQLTSTKDLPAHGFVRQALWNLKNISTINSRLTRVTLSIEINEQTHPSWPFHATINAIFDIGDSLNVNFEVNNTGDQLFTYSSALHTYFSVQHIHQTTINGLDDCDYHDCLDDWKIKEQAGDIVICEEVDRLYYHEDDKTISIHDEQREVVITSQHSNSCIIWNPWIEKAKRLSAFNNDAYQHMLCIETANAGNDYVTLEPQTSYTLTVSIK